MKDSSVTKLPPPVVPDPEDHELLTQVVAYHHATLQQSPEALAYLEGHGLRSAGMMERFQLGFTIGFSVSAIQAGVNGASIGEALQAGAISGAISVGTAAVLGPVGGAIAELNPVAGLAFDLALTGYGAYTTVQGFQAGQYALGALGITATAFGLYRLVKNVQALRVAQGAMGLTAVRVVAVRQGATAGESCFRRRSMSSTPSTTAGRRRIGTKWSSTTKRASEDARTRGDTPFISLATSR